ncbi:hypothetical protein [Parafrankia soli]|uniref:hypothetical protein n=1 Tax=Parafrankia soli TaxID=2599596 RepID=UPI0018E3C110|nr:hypothetical protein [Parafrankia soli]
MGDHEDSQKLSISESAVAMHEIFLSLQAAGFTEQQALYLVGQMFRPGASP